MSEIIRYRVAQPPTMAELLAAAAVKKIKYLQMLGVRKNPNLEVTPEMAAERVAVRERRELVPEVTGEGREAVLAQVEADRREQLGRVQAQAERRVERRVGLAGRVGEKLLEQARALRERIGQELKRVKEWVLERFGTGKVSSTSTVVSG